MLKKLILVSAAVFGNAEAFSQQAMPEALLLPWTFSEEVDRDWRGQNADALQDAWDRVGKRLIPTGRSLKQFAASNGLEQIIQGAALSERLRVGTPVAALLPNQAAVWQPIICPVADQWIVALEVSGFEDQLLYAAAHTRLPRASVEDARRQGRENILLSEALDVLAQQLSAGPISEAPANGSTMKLGFSLAPSSVPSTSGSPLCLSMLLSHEVHRTHRVVRMLGNNEVTHARDVLKLKNQEQRANRRAVLFWEAEPAARLPMRVNLTVRYAESVFANSMGRGETAPITVNPDLSLTPHAELAGLLQRESSALQTVDAPQIAKIDRAWVYLDRGRAWGLKMNDRVVHRMANGEYIKGHVVAFYGPNLKVQSPRGYPITEGAIVFVRKGQRDTRVGQAFEFDPTAYPTPWPPQKTP